MSGFSDKLGVLVAAELASASRDPQRMGVMTERVACALGLVVATAAKGHGPAIDELIVCARPVH